MNKILQLSREYRKQNHVELLSHTNNEILEKLFFCMMKNVRSKVNTHTKY